MSNDDNASITTILTMICYDTTRFVILIIYVLLGITVNRDPLLG